MSVDKLGEEARELHRNAIKACAQSSVERHFLHQSCSARGPNRLLPRQASIMPRKRILPPQGSNFTALRHGFYAESCLTMIGDDLKAGVLRVPEDGPVSWTARADLAEADAALLSGSRMIDGATPPLIATCAVTMAEIAHIASEVTGRKIRHETVRR